jgi:hypothetical protein
MRFSIEPESDEEELQVKFGRRKTRLLSVDTDSDTDEDSSSSETADSEQEAFPVSKSSHSKATNISLYSDLDLWDLQGLQARKDVWVRVAFLLLTL